MSSVVSASHPPSRPWIQLAPLDRSAPTALFTVMSYNVLCDRYATRNLYGYCPQWALNWEYRKKGILDEVGKGRPRDLLQYTGHMGRQ